MSVASVNENEWAGCLGVKAGSPHYLVKRLTMLTGQKKRIAQKVNVLVGSLDVLGEIH